MERDDGGDGDGDGDGDGNNDSPQTGKMPQLDNPSNKRSYFDRLVV